MNKKLRLVLLVLTVLVLTCSCVLADAADKAEKNYNKICQMVDKANAKVEKLVAHAQKTKKDDVDWLLEKVKDVVDPVFAYAEEIDVQVICIYENYWIDGRWVEVDPLKVINENT